MDLVFFFQAEDGIRDCLLSRGLGDVYKRQQYVDVSCIWGQDGPGYYFFLICVIDSIKGFSRCRGYQNTLLSICCVYIYMFGWLCRATYESYCSVVSTCLLYTSQSPRDKRQSRMPSSA